MDWWDSLVGGVSDLFGGGDTASTVADTATNTGSWLSRNMDWIKPVASAGIGYLGQANKDSSQQDFVKLAQQQELEKWQAGKQSYDAYIANVAQAQAVAAANSKSRAAAAAAYAKAARETEANRQAAMQKAMKRTDKGYNDALSMFQPYVAAGKELLPQMTNTYSNGLNTMNMLNAYLTKPENMALLDQASQKPIAQVDIGLPVDFFKGAYK